MSAKKNSKKPKPAKPQTVSAPLRAAIKESEKNGTTLYRLAKDAKVQYATLHRFVNDSIDVRLSTVDSLAGVLGLELTPR
jgi:hypothetical protein